MISGRDFVVLSDAWDGLPTSAIHLFRRLASQNRVFWFNSIGRLPRFSADDARKVLHAFREWTGSRRNGHSQAGQEFPNVHVVAPVMVPWFKPFVRRFNQGSLLREYDRLCARHGITAPIVLTTFPYTVDFVRAVPDALKVYYCVDDFLDYPGVNHADWAVMEAELLQAVDAIVVTSQTLARKRRNACPLLHLPHGVDFDHFHQARAFDAPEPRLAGIPRPIVGFFGLLSEWVDLNLVAYLARAFPAVSFVLIGRSETDLGPLAGLPNVHTLGYVPYADLPRYARSFDVGLIPFVLNRLTKAVNPLKLMEYFALGLPVLSTRLPELMSIDGPLWLAVRPEEFRAALGRILPQAGRLRDEALDIARSNTWDARVEQLSDFLEERVAVPA
jgi:glycosyltransferase involved in cell wall biosynthesis